jgi:hypothetical protein
MSDDLQSDKLTLSPTTIGKGAHSITVDENAHLDMTKKSRYSAIL